MRSEWVLPGQGTVKRETSRLFGNWEAKPASWLTTNLGLAGESDSLAGFIWTPRISTNFHFNTENTLRIGYSRAHRTGSIYDYRADYFSGPGRYQFRADPNMPTERLDTWELGYLGDWRDWRASLDVRLFHEKIHDRLYIIDRNASDNAVPSLTMPIQDVRIRGIEYQLKWQPFEPTPKSLHSSFFLSLCHCTRCQKRPFREEYQMRQAFPIRWSSGTNPNKRESQIFTGSLEATQ
jgi:iron complex outermembrane receptor protein